jgi:hypothetical protein
MVRGVQVPSSLSGILLDHLEELEQDPVDALGLHPRQVRPELVHMLLAQVPKQQGAVGGLRPRGGRR